MGIDIYKYIYKYIWIYFFKFPTPWGCMVCKVGMSLYCIQILHAKLGSFENEKKNCGLGVFLGWFCFVFVFVSFRFPLVAFAETKGWDVVVTHMHAPTELHTKEGEWEHFSRLTELHKKLCFLLLKKKKRVNKKDYLNISHFKKTFI